jgi:hypothetical protein
MVTIAAMDERFSRLRELTLTATDLSVPWDYFREELTEHPEFRKIGHNAPNDPLHAMIYAGLKKVVDAKIELTPPIFVHVPAFRFWHGFSETNDNAMVVSYYDEEVDRGITCIVSDPTTGVDALFLRFSVMDVKEPFMISNHRGQA